MIKQQKIRKMAELKQEIKLRNLSTEADCIQNIKPFRSFRVKNQPQIRSQMSQAGIEDNLQQSKKRTLRQNTCNAKPILQEIIENHQNNGELRYNSNMLEHGMKINEDSTIRNYTNIARKSGLTKNNLNNIKKSTITFEKHFSASNNPRQEIKSIIFDSKVQRFESFYEKDLKLQSFGNNQCLHDQNINKFKEKVNRVNIEIEDGINNLEKMIQNLKKKKVSQSLLASKMASEQAISKQANVFQMYESIIKQNEKIGKEIIKGQTYPQNKKEVTQQLKNLQITNSLIELNGDTKAKNLSFPPQYTSFINRLANQIQIDMEFTTMISELSKKHELAAIKNLIFGELVKYQTDIKIDQTFFQIQPSEIDPLEQNKPNLNVKYTFDEQKQISMKIYKKYKDIQSHFETKLKSKFEKDILAIFFDELAKFNSSNGKVEDSESVTIGHLLSYLNMRTNKSFRNRFFVKMMKRLNLKSSNILSLEALKCFVFLG